MMSVNHILRKCTGGNKLHKSQEKNQLPNVHGRHKNYLQKIKKELDTLKQAVRIWNQDIEMEFTIEK